MKRLLVVLGALIIAVYIISTAFVAVDETEVAVITLFGKPVRVVQDAGLTVKWPDPIQTTIRLDKRLQHLDSNLGEFLTRDKKNLVASSFMLWRIADPEKFIRSVKDISNANRRLSDLVGSELGVAIGQFPLTDFLTVDESGSKIPEIFKDVTEVCHKHATEEFGIDLVMVRLRRLGFPSQNLRSVYERMRAERERMAKKYRAEGDEEAATIRSQTDKEVRELLADAYRQAQVTKGQGEAEAIRIYADALRKDPKYYKLTRTLQAYRKFLDEKTTLILSSKSPLFQYLEQPPKGD